MKRPLAYIGITMIIAYVVVFYFGINTAIISASVCGAVFAFTCIVKSCNKYRKYAFVIALVSVLVIVWFSVYTVCIYNPLSSRYNNQRVSIEATVAEEPHSSYNSWYYYLKTAKVENKSEGCSILLQTSTQLDVSYGDTIFCDVELFSCDNSYYLSRGCNYLAKPDDYSFSYRAVKNNPRDLKYYCMLANNTLTNAVSTLIPGDEALLCNAIAFGDRFGMPKRLYNHFSDTGLSYFIVVSGIHMNIVAGFIMFLFKRFPKRGILNCLRYVFVVLFIILFMLLTDLTPSVVRSGIMILISYLGSSIKRKHDPLTDLGVAAIVLTAFNPYAVGDLGILLSFSSVWGILVIYPMLRNNLRKIIEKPKIVDGKVYVKCWRKALMFVLNVMCASISANIMVIPLLLIHINEFSPFVAITSLLLTPIISVILIFTLFIGILWYIPVLNIFAYALGYFCYYLAKFVIFLVSLFAEIPYSAIAVKQKFILLWLCICIGIFGVILLLNNRKRYVKYGVVFSYLCLFLLVCIQWMLQYPYDKSFLRIYPVGEGVSAAIVSPYGADVISCGGNPNCTRDIIYNLSTETSAINTLIVPSAKNYDSRYASEILKTFDVSNVMMYYKYTTNEETYRLAKTVGECSTFHNYSTTKLEFYSDITDTIICQSDKTWQYIESENTKVLIAPQGCRADELPEKYRSCDVLILSENIENINLLSYDTVLWTSDEDVPKEYKNAEIVTDTVSILL